MDVPQRARKLVDDLAGEGWSPEAVSDIVGAAFIDTLLTLPDHASRERALNIFMAMLKLAMDIDDEAHEA
jgi:hypothetical protein